MDNEQKQAKTEWRKWAMEQAVLLCAAGVIPTTKFELEEMAVRIYNWTALEKRNDVIG